MEEIIGYTSIRSSDQLLERQPRNQHEHYGYEAALHRTVCVTQHRDTPTSRNAHIFVPQTD
jgi:hypothetical protein